MTPHYRPLSAGSVRAGTSRPSWRHGKAPGPARSKIAQSKIDRPRSQLDRARSKIDRARSQIDRARSKTDRPRSKTDCPRSKIDRARPQIDRARPKTDRPRSKIDRARSTNPNRSRVTTSSSRPDRPVPPSLVPPFFTPFRLAPFASWVEACGAAIARAMAAEPDICGGCSLRGRGRAAAPYCRRDHFRFGRVTSPIGCLRDRRMETVVPSPGALSTPTRPPCTVSTTFFTFSTPSPRPVGQDATATASSSNGTPHP